MILFPRLLVRGTISAVAFSALASSPVLAISLSALSGGYDVLVRQNANFDNVHIHGATAVGGNLTLTGTRSEFLMDPVTRPVGLRVGGSIIQNADGRILNSGKLQVGTLTPNQTVVSGSLKSSGGQSLDFNSGQSTAADLVPQTFSMAAAFNELGGLSASLAGMTETLSLKSIVSDNRFKFTLGTASGSGLDVLNITGDQLASLVEINFDHSINFTQKLVINVNLKDYKGGAFAQQQNGNLEANNILWNFYGGTSLFLQNQFVGSILAPGIDLQHSNNDINGSVYANSFTNSGGEVHVHAFNFDFPPTQPVPDAGSTGLLALLAFPLLMLFKRKG